MSNYQSLADYASSRADTQQLRWRNLMNQCDGAKRKLAQLRQYAERYRLQMRGSLSDGMEATATMGFFRFIAQIEAVTAKQENEVARLEQACLDQWNWVVAARRDKRMFEVLRDRATAAEIEAALRRSQVELDELMGRIVKLI